MTMQISLSFVFKDELIMLWRGGGKKRILLLHPNVLLGTLHRSMGMGGLQAVTLGYH